MTCTKNGYNDLDMYECNCTKQSYSELKPLQLNIKRKYFSLPVEAWMEYRPEKEIE